MTPDPILSAPLLVQLHLAAALPAVLIGPVVLFRRARDRLHKALGYLWIAAIVALSVTGLLIPSDFPLIGPFGPIHLFSLVALWGVAEGLVRIRRGDVAGHLAVMPSVWFGAVGLAGLFTLLPGRTLNRAVFSEPSAAGFLAIAIGVAILAPMWHLRPRGPAHRGDAK
jgi:uncharacterized membrane protein